MKKFISVCIVVFTIMFIGNVLGAVNSLEELYKQQFETILQQLRVEGETSKRLTSEFLYDLEQQAKNPSLNRTRLERDRDNKWNREVEENHKGIKELYNKMLDLEIRIAERNKGKIPVWVVELKEKYISKYLQGEIDRLFDKR